MISTLSRSLLLFVLFSSLTAHAQSKPTGTIKRDQIVDTDGDGFADPGDIVRFTVTATNPNATPFDGTVVALDIFTGATLLESSIILSQGTFTRDGQFITITLGSLAPFASATFVYDQSVNGPVGFESAQPVCGNGSLKFPDSTSSPLQALNGAQLGFGSCMQEVDFDDDEIADNNEVCVNVPHSSPKLDQVIPASGSTTHAINSSINITRKGLITSTDLGLMIKHSWVGDLIVRLTHVNTGTSIRLIDRPGVPASSFGCSSDNIKCNFSASGFPTAENTCTLAPLLPAIGGLFSAEDSIDAFNGESMSGEWKLTIEDAFPSGDGGSLTQWCLNLQGATEISASTSAPATSLSNNRFVQRLIVTNNGPADLLDLSINHFAPVGLSLKKAEIVGNGSPLPKLVAIPVGSSLTADFEVEPTTTYPYHELIISSPAAIAATYDVAAAPLSAQLTPAGLSGQVVMADFLYNLGFCTLQNAPALQGNIALIPLVFCQAQSLVDAVAAAGAQAVILRLSYPSDPFLLADPLPLTSSVGIPVLSPSNNTFDSIANASGNKQATLRANPSRQKWNLTTSFNPFSPRVQVSNFAQILESLRTTTEIQIDSDLDGTSDINDQCIADAAKSAPGTCGCGVADQDSDGDGSADCNDQCASDPLKSSLGVCGCGVADSDKEPNGIIDCSTGREVYARYSSLQPLVKSLKPVVLTGNKRKDSAKKRALKDKILKIKTILAEIDALIINPTKAILLSNPAINLVSESLSAKKKTNAALKTNAEKFSKNKKAAVASLTKILGLVVNSD